LSVVDVLVWAAWVIRDLMVVWAVAMAGVALLTTLVKLLTGSRPRLGDLAEKGIPAWVVAAVGCLAPLDRGMLFPRSTVIVGLVLSGLCWVLVFVISSWVR